MLLTGTRTSVNETSPWPMGSSYIPIVGSSRSTFTPGVSSGTSTIVCRWWRSMPGSSSRFSGVSRRPMKTAIRHSGCPTPVDHHLRPLMTTSSPWTTAVASMLVASEDATSGSVIVNAERISPASSGSSHCARCSGVP